MQKIKHLFNLCKWWRLYSAQFSVLEFKLFKRIEGELIKYMSLANRNLLHYFIIDPFQNQLTFFEG